MDDDNDKKSGRGGDRKPAGSRGGSGFDKGGRPGGGKKFGKPGNSASEKPRRDARSGARPEAARNEGAAGEARPFRKDDKRPFVKRGEGQPQEKRDARPYEKREFKPRDKGGDRPYAKREDGRDRTARPGRFERPAENKGSGVSGEPRFEKRPRDGGSPARKPFAKRDRADARPQGEKRFDRPKRDFDERKPKPGGFKPPSHPTDAPPDPEGERIAKRLARAGIASRRDAEELIAAGRIKVNGKVLSSPAFNVLPSDVIHLDETEIPAAERTRLFLFHKPAGLVTTNRDPEGRRTVFDVLPAELPRLMTVGRLDINTEGLLLLTNDGGLSRVLELPATGWLRRYRVRVHGKVEEKALADLANGIAVDGVFYGAVEASLERTQGANAWLAIGLREGKNREVKNILGALGLEVTRLIRVSYGPFQLGELREGHVLEVNGRTLREQLGERLIEDSGANFEADIATPFSNKPVRRHESREEEPTRAKFQRDGDRRPIGEGGLIKARKRRENSRDEALGKLSTRPERSGFSGRSEKPDFSDKPGRSFAGKPGADKRGGGRKGEREQRPIEPPGQRRANVWMAPGARPQTSRAEDEQTGKPRKDGPARSGSGGDRPRPKPGKPSKRRS
jgi:23S rRNA pseudouridine2605 synthase